MKYVFEILHYTKTYQDDKICMTQKLFVITMILSHMHNEKRHGVGRTLAIINIRGLNGTCREEPQTKIINRKPPHCNHQTHHLRNVSNCPESNFRVQATNDATSIPITIPCISLS